MANRFLNCVANIKKAKKYLEMLKRQKSIHRYQIQTEKENIENHSIDEHSLGSNDDDDLVPPIQSVISNGEAHN